MVSVTWNPWIVWTQAIAESLMAVAYFSIALALGINLFARKRLVFPWFFALLAVFFLFCGVTQALSAVMAWAPAFGIDTLFKVVTAIMSVVAAISLWRLIPRMFVAPSVAALGALNGELAMEVEQRRQAELSLRCLNDALHVQIAQRDWEDRRFKIFVDAVESYAILMLDPAGNVTSWNAGAERIKGYAESEIIGRHFSRFYTAEDQTAGRPRLGLEIAAAEGRFEDEGWRVKKDGSRFWAGVVITALRSPDGEISGYGKVTRDLTEHRRVQQELTAANVELEQRIRERTDSLLALTSRLEAEIEERKAAEERRREVSELLEATFSAAPLPIMITGPNLEVIMWNKAGEKTFGYAERELIAKGYGQLVPRDGWEEADHIRAAVAVGPLNLVSRAARADGSVLDIRVSAVPLFREDGTVRAIVTMMEDLTQANQIEAQLRQSQKMEAIGTLTGGMAHDFNNLLGIIIGNIELLRETRPDDPEVNELASEALDAATRGAELTRSLLAFARRQPLQPIRLELDVLIGGLVRLLARLLGEDIEVNLSLSDDVCAVVADPAQLEAALTNLATNARDAMPRGGRLTIATGHRRLDADYAAANPDVPPGSYAMIEVTDTGIGMPPDIKARIFEPFFTTKNERGTGLGLSMVFGFMKQSGGHISVYSEVGVGTTIRLYFPCSFVAEDRKIDLRPDGPLAGNGETILVVEDSAPLRRIVVRQLRGLGYRVLEAGNGADALFILGVENVDLLFTDVVMPGGIDGFELADSALRRAPTLKIILTSGFPQSRFASDVRPQPFTLLSKPYRKGNLAQLIRGALDGSGSTAHS